MKSNYQLWSSGPSFYSLCVMFTLLLEEATYSKTITVAEFVSLFALVQSIAGQMAGIATFLVALDSSLSNQKPVFDALSMANEARRWCSSQPSPGQHEHVSPVLGHELIADTSTEEHSLVD